MKKEYREKEKLLGGVGGFHLAVGVVIVFPVEVDGVGGRGVGETDHAAPSREQRQVPERQSLLREEHLLAGLGHQLARGDRLLHQVLAVVHPAIPQLPLVETKACKCRNNNNGTRDKESCYFPPTDNGGTPDQLWSLQYLCSRPKNS